MRGAKCDKAFALPLPRLQAFFFFFEYTAPPRRLVVSLVREGRQLAAYSGVSCQKEVMLRKRRGEFGSRRHAAADFFVFRCSISGNIPEPTAAYQNIAELWN
jgi:hypothetical protein